MDPSRLRDDIQGLERLREKIYRCVTIQNFIDVYETNDAFRGGLERHRQLMNAGNGDRITNARKWSKRCRDECDMEARSVNLCRNVCLKMLSELCDRCPSSITEDEIRNGFGRQRVFTILDAFLPMERAMCLYTMKYASGQNGMHWVAKSHLQENPGVWGHLLDKVGGRNTINKRYIWLANLFGPPTADDYMVTWCLQPAFAPWLIGVVENENDDEVNITTPNVDVHFPTLYDTISNCNLVESLRDVYDGIDFQLALGKVRSIIGNSEPVEWSLEWAVRMRSDLPSDDDVFCDSVRRTMLHYLERSRQLAEGNAALENAIVQIVSGHRIVNIMKVLLPMQLEWCRYTAQYRQLYDTPHYGMCWFSEEHARTNPWREWLELGPATIPTSFPWLRSLRGLELESECLIVQWLEPAKPEWVLEDLDVTDESTERQIPFRLPSSV